MTYSILPLTEDPWQVFTLDLTINGEPFHWPIPEKPEKCMHKSPETLENYIL